MPGSARAALLSPRKAGLRGPAVGLLPGIASLASRVLPGDVLGAWHGLQPAELPSKVTDPARASRHIPRLSCCLQVTTVGSRGHFPAGWLCRARRGSQGKAGSEAVPVAGGARSAPQSRPFSLLTQIRSRAKIEKIRASLFNNNDLIGLSSLDGEDELMEMSTEEILTVSVVNQSLFDTQGSPGLEDYFNDKSIKGESWVF